MLSIARSKQKHIFIIVTLLFIIWLASQVSYTSWFLLFRKSNAPQLSASETLAHVTMPLEKHVTSSTVQNIWMNEKILEQFCESQALEAIEQLPSYAAFDAQNPDFDLFPIHTSRPPFTYEPHFSNSTAMTRAVVAVIVPFYNAGKAFASTIQSIMQQSLQQFEVIIINDGSTLESSIKMLEHYRDGRMDKRIRVLDHSINKGTSAARNTAIRACNSDYVFLLDADDMIEPTVLEKLYWLLESNLQYAFANGHAVNFGASKSLVQKGFETREQFLKENVSPVTAMFRKSFLIANPFDETLTQGAEDWDFYLQR